MFSLTLRTKPEAKLPKAARRSCGCSLKANKATERQMARQLPARDWCRGLVALAARSSHVVPGTHGRSTFDCFANRVEIELQNPEALS
jgi:hypothetical protein